MHTHQLEFANTSLPTLVCRVKAALESPFERAHEHRLPVQNIILIFWLELVVFNRAPNKLNYFKRL